MESSDKDKKAPQPGSRNNPLDVAVVGAGFSGICILHHLLAADFKARVFEVGGAVGGTWYWNCYPGARCDGESLQYSYQFDEALQQEWCWSERYSPQAEIQRYLEHVVDRFHLRDDIQLNTRVEAAHFNAELGLWHVRAASAEIWSRFLIMATGCLSTAYTPTIAGLDVFAGETYHTSHWPKTPVDFSGKHVAVIGTGSSGVQCVPIIAQQAEKLYVLQRTPSYSVPARNGPMDPEYERQIKSNYAAFRAANWLKYGGSAANQNPLPFTAYDRENVQRELEERWQFGGVGFAYAFSDVLENPAANAALADFCRDKIRGIVKDAQTAEALCPTIPFGCKRLTANTDFYETFNRDNVTLVDLRQAPIESFTRAGIKTSKEEIPLDAVVFATGFDAMTGSLFRIDIRGRNSVSLREHWADGPRTYLGLMTTEFPNFFTITGPGSPSVFSNVAVSIEQHCNFIIDCLRHMRERDAQLIEPNEADQVAWGKEVRRIAEPLEQMVGCNSWYLGSNIPGKPRMYTAHIDLPLYVRTCAEIVADDYRGFKFT